jgi:hypothetical protein
MQFGRKTRLTGAAGLLALLLAALLAAPGSHAAPTKPAPPPADAAGLQTVQTPYYSMYTDLDPDAVQEASLRMTRMAEEYHERTKGFAGTVNSRLPFYLFKTPEPYFRRGGIPGSAGVYMRSGGDRRLMAIAGEETSDRTWHVVQHEGFHQFADATIGELPTWINEGLAEYFGEAVWTGDMFVAGIIPPRRLKEIQGKIKGKEFRPLKEMMQVSQAEWNARLASDNYHQAWAMSHFLAHGDDGKYQGAFVTFMRAIGKGVQWEKAWAQSFGSADGFEKVWADWWLAQSADPTADLYARATLSTLTSYVARAYNQKQNFTSLDGFLKAVETKEFKLSGENWLPPALLDRAIKGMARDDTKFSMEPGGKGQSPKLIAVRPDGVKMIATFPVRPTVPVKVSVDVDDLAPAVEKAKAAAAAGGKKADARAKLQDAIRRNPKSDAMPAAKQALNELK